MTARSAQKRIIQKLDFENCIVTNYKTTAKRRKKLRARITREIEHFPDFPEETEESHTHKTPSPVFGARTQAKIPGSTSPVFTRRGTVSPVFFKRRMLNFTEIENPSESPTVIPSSPGSPVFKAFKKQKTLKVSPDHSSEVQKVLGRITSIDMFNSTGNSSSEVQIDEFTLESKQSVKISSVDSAEAKKETSSFETNSLGFPMVINEFLVQSKSECMKSVKRNYKKNSLLARLQKLRKKQASEKLLWQHQNQINVSECLTFSVVSLWNEESMYFLKCESTSSVSELSFLIVDCRWVPIVKKVKEGSLMRLHPPWQKLHIEEISSTVLINVICLDLLDETIEPTKPPPKMLESLPTEQFETDKNLFIDSLFSSHPTCYLY